MEVIVLDGNSPDQTEKVVGLLAAKHKNLRYFKEPINGGIDQDFDKATRYARGKYCWLMTDDDVIAPDTISKILVRLKQNPSLLILNATVYDRFFESKLLDKFIKSDEDRVFSPLQQDDFFALAGACLSFIGCVIILRSEWDSRDRKSYYGTLFVHFGVIFQKPFTGPIMVMAEPLIKIRYGNALWTARGFEIWMIKWPDLIHSFHEISIVARDTVCSSSLKRFLKYLIYYRGMGIYSTAEYHQLLAPRLRGPIKIAARLITFIPCHFLNSLLAIYFSLFNRAGKLGFYDLATSKGSSFITMWIAEKIIFGRQKWMKKTA